MKSNYDGSEYGQVTVGRGKAVHFGNVEDNMTACGKRGYLEDGAGWEVTCKVCVKMAETTHDGSRPLIKDEQPAAPVEPEPTQTFEVTYLAPRTGTQRVERVEAATVHAVPVQPRDAEVLLSIYLVTKESALFALTEASAEARRKYEATKAPATRLQEAERHDAWGLACVREVKMRQRAWSLGATVDETYAAMIAGIRQVDPNY